MPIGDVLLYGECWSVMVLEGPDDCQSPLLPSKGLARLVLFTLTGLTDFRRSQPFCGKNAGGLETPKAHCQLNHAPYKMAVDMPFSLLG